MKDKKGLTYSDSGVDYGLIDPLKRMAQKAGRATARNLAKHGLQEKQASRGESAYVVEGEREHYAFVQEGLGTKNRVADNMRTITGKTYYDSLAQDTVAMIVNDLITVGAAPITILAYWAVGNSSWFKDQERMQDLVEGWRRACDLSGASWGGGETPTLAGIIEGDTIDLAGSAFGIVAPKERLILGANLSAGDAIVVFESSGIHANGLTLARTISEKLAKGFQTKLPSGKMYGEALLEPTLIYARLIQELFNKDIDIHYMANITGHGWRKLMRHSDEFTYRIHTLPHVPEVLQFIVKQGPIQDKEAYANFNMGAGFAVFVPESYVSSTVAAAQSQGIRAYHIGSVRKGEKQVIIEPLNITYGQESLQVKA